MPVFQVHYTNAREAHVVRHETDWITPDGYDLDQARSTFERAYPNASITRILPFTDLDREPA